MSPSPTLRTKSPVVLRQISQAFRALAANMSSSAAAGSIKSPQYSIDNTKPEDPVEAAKWAVAEHAVDQHVTSGMAIGVGTGSTARYLVSHLAERFAQGSLSGIHCVPSSFQAKQLIVRGGLPLSDLEQHPSLDVCIDGADEVDPSLACIKGGGGCLTQEKIVQSCAAKFVVIADDRKASDRLGEKFGHLPIEVIPFAYAPVRDKIASRFGGSVHLRMASKKAGPVITDSGNYLLDWDFPKGGAKEWDSIHSQIKLIPGVVETGLFVGAADIAHFAKPDGSVMTWARSANGNGLH